MVPQSGHFTDSPIRIVFSAGDATIPAKPGGVNRRSDGAAVFGAYAATCAIWGTTWLGIKVSLRYLPPLTGVGLRFIISGLLLYAVAFALRAARLRKPETSPFPLKLVLVLAIFLFGLNYVLTYVSETRLDSGLVAVLFGTFPFFVFAFGHWFANERTTARTWLGAAVGLGGVAVISLGGQVRAAPFYALAQIAAAAVSAVGNVYAKRHSHHDPLRTLPPSMLIAGTCVGAIGMFVERTDWHRAVQPPSLAALLYLAIFGSGIAFFLNLWVLQRIAAWIVGLSALIIPVVAVVVGIVLGGETFTLRELEGAALVIAGIWLSLTTPTEKEASDLG
jgi:drug/metabolite transporter (DMT)-like permease